MTNPPGSMLEPNLALLEEEEEKKEQAGKTKAPSFNKQIEETIRSQGMNKQECNKKVRQLLEEARKV